MHGTHHTRGVTARASGLFHSTLIAVLLAGSFSLAAHAQTVPATDPRQWGMRAIGAPAAWALGYNGQGVTVAVGDTGIAFQHPDFAGKIDSRSRTFLLNAPGTTYVPSAYADLARGSHGTHVAGIIMASPNGGVPGIAYNANVVALKLLTSCTRGQNCTAPGIPNASAAAINYFAGLNDVLIFNGSFGPVNTAGQTVWPTSSIFTGNGAAIQNAVDAGKILVFSTGNDRGMSPVAGLNPKGNSLFPFIRPANANANVYDDGGNNFDFSAMLNGPGIVIGATAMTQQKTLASYAQACGVTASWCITAPGGETRDTGNYSQARTQENNYGGFFGTSAAAPMVSGVLAVLEQAYPGYSARDLANVIFATAENIDGKPADNLTYGYGLVRLDRSVAGPTNLAPGAAVSVAAQDVTYWSQPLTTSGGFSKTGPGYLIIAGRTSATGAVTVQSGALGVDGTLSLANGMTVANGAMLAGFGRIVGNTTINGTLNAGQLPNYADLKANNGGVMPGSIPLTGTSPGSLTFQGSVSFGASATTRVNVDGMNVVPGGPGTWDKLIVTGAGSVFTAGGALAPILRDIPGAYNDFTPALGDKFTFVTGTDGAVLRGRFTSIVQPTNALATNTRFDVVYSASAFTLDVTPASFAALEAGRGANANVRNFTKALDSARPSAGQEMQGAQEVLFDDLYDNTPAQDDAELTSLAGQEQAANAGAALNAVATFGQAIGNRQSAMALRQSDADAPEPAMLEAFSGWTVWGQGHGGWSHVDASSGLPGAHSSAQGFALGIDGVYAPDLRVGAALGYDSVGTSSAGGFADTKTYSGALYGTWTPDLWDVQGRVAIAGLDQKTTRTVSVLGTTEVVDGSTDGIGTLLALQAGYRLDAGGVTLEPLAGFTAQTLRRNGFTETTPFGLTFPTQTFARFTTELGGKVAAQFDIADVTVMPQVKLVWAHDAGDAGLVTHAAIFGSPFAIDAAHPGRDAARVNVEIDAWTEQNFSLFAGYTGDFRSNGASQEITGGVRLAL